MPRTLKCKICLENMSYDTRTRLSCGHGFCRKCVDVQFRKNLHFFQCPICQEKDNLNKCPICLSNMETKYTSVCNHTFCRPCLIHWMICGDESCPLCKKETGLEYEIIMIKDNNNLWKNSKKTEDTIRSEYEKMMDEYSENYAKSLDEEERKSSRGNIRTYLSEEEDED